MYWTTEDLLDRSIQGGDRHVERLVAATQLFYDRCGNDIMSRDDDYRYEIDDMALLTTYFIGRHVATLRWSDDMITFAMTERGAGIQSIRADVDEAITRLTALTEGWNSLIMRLSRQQAHHSIL